MLESCRNVGNRLLDKLRAIARHQKRCRAWKGRLIKPMIGYEKVRHTVTSEVSYDDFPGMHGTWERVR